VTKSHHFLHCRKTDLCRPIPVKLRGSFRGPRPQLATKVSVRHRLLQLVGDSRLIVWIEKRFAPTDYFRNTGTIGANHRSATCHRLQRRQAKPLVF
jgi:hypothetical protein